jgi:hypothetical protein
MKGMRKASMARTCLEGPRLLASAALDVTAKRSDPSPPALGAARPLRLAKALAAGHPLPQGERAGEFEILRAGSTDQRTRNSARRRLGTLTNRCPRTSGTFARHSGSATLRRRLRSPMDCDPSERVVRGFDQPMSR